MKLLFIKRNEKYIGEIVLYKMRISTHTDESYKGGTQIYVFLTIEY